VRPEARRLITTATRGVDDKAAKPNAADDLICEEIRENYLLWQQQDAEFLKNADEELEFAAGEHWKDHDRDKRQELQAQDRSAFTIDLINPSVELVVNQTRINKRSAKFIPVDEDADDKTAEVRQGLYRNIERESRAAVARETAYDYAVRVGRGYYRVLIEDEPGLTFNKRIAIRRIDNLHAVAIDQAGIEADYSDAEWGMIWDDIPIRQFRAEHGDIPDLDTQGLALPEGPERDTWFRKSHVRRVEYFRRNWFMRRIAKLPPGFQVNGRQFCEAKDVPQGVAPVAFLNKRDYKIQKFRASGTQILDREDWKGRWVPIIVVVGREVFRGRKAKIHSGMVRPAMDLSRVHDYMESRLVDEVALSPLPHMFAAEGQLSPGQEKIVSKINRHPWTVITYTIKTDKEGRALPAPAWISPSPNIAAVVAGAAHAKDNLQRVLSTYSPQLGAIQGDQSGKAIREVKDQGDVTHASFPDNLTRAQLQEARVVNDLMDYVYNEPQAITITQLDETTKQILINQPHTDPDTGEEKHYLFGSGKYDVALEIEQAYPTRLAEASDKLLDMAKVIPSLPIRAPDLLIQAIGLPGLLGEKIKDRLRPADIDDKNPLPPVAQAKIAQAQQVIQHLTQALNETSQIITQKRIELGSAEHQTLMKVMGTLIAADFKYGSEEAQLKFKSFLQLAQGREAQLEQSPETANPEATPPQSQPAPAPPAGANGAPPLPGMPPGPPAGPPPGQPPPGAPPV
jgi:hypothetical protein